ncbi:MAG: hypothetical protein ACHQ7M_01210 [Chloroflexota bacterium]
MFQRLTRAFIAAALLSAFSLVDNGIVTFAADDPGIPPPRSGSHQHSAQRVCDQPAAGAAACHARRRTDEDATLARPASGKHPSKARPDFLGNTGAYDPSYLKTAYTAPWACGGAGQTVAIVDAHDAPSAESDLASYRSYFGLPACTTANGCFRKVTENGQPGPLPAANSGWGQEISLDLDMVSAICPNCHILLVEANSASFGDLGAAVNTAARMGATAVSNSYGGGEFSAETTFDTSYFNHPGVTITASSGDSGYGVEYPAASRYVTAVGGTTLNQTGNGGGRNATETVWSGAGSGCSAFESKPSWQKDSGCSRRTVADVSADADPNTGVWVYDGGWYVFGGTSVAAPVIAAMSALAGNGPATSYPSSFPYAAPSSLNDVTSGSNGSCGSYLCNGQPGYDGPSGLGTPNTSNAFTFHSASDFGIAISPASETATPGGSASYAVTLTAVNGYASAVNLSAAGLPTGAGATFSSTAITPSSGGASSTMTVNLSSNVANGSYPLTITGTGSDPSAATHTATTTLVVAAQAVPDFSLSVSPSSQSVATTGGSVSYTLSLASVNGYSSSVNLSVKGAPSGATASFSPSAVAPASPAATSGLTITVPVGAAANSYQLTITGTGTDASATSHSATATLVVTSAGTFSLAATPSSRSASPGGTASYAATLSTSNGYSSSVSLAVSGLPSGATATFNPASVVPASGGATSTLQVQLGSSTPTGSYTVTITGTGTDSASIKQTTTVSLNVADFSLTAAQPTLTVNRGGSGNDVLDLTALGGYSSAVTLSVSGLPNRVSSSFSSNPVTPGASPGASSTLTIAAGSARRSTQTLTITARGADGTTHSTTVTLIVQ